MKDFRKTNGRGKQIFPVRIFLRFFTLRTEDVRRAEKDLLFPSAIFTFLNQALKAARKTGFHLPYFQILSVISEFRSKPHESNGYSNRSRQEHLLRCMNLSRKPRIRRYPIRPSYPSSRQTAHRLHP